MHLILTPGKMKNLNFRIIYTQTFFVDTVYNRVFYYSNSTRWPIITVSYTKPGFVFINILKFGNIAIVRIVVIVVMLTLYPKNVKFYVTLFLEMTA